MFKLDVFDVYLDENVFLLAKHCCFFYDEKQLCMVSTNSSPRGIVCDIFEGVF